MKGGNYVLDVLDASHILELYIPIPTYRYTSRHRDGQLRAMR